MTIIDVRSPDEYKLGHVEKSINIPLQEVRSHLAQIRSLSPPVILCCATGTRSQVATDFLINHGIVCKNGGSWKDLEIS